MAFLYWCTFIQSSSSNCFKSAIWFFTPFSWNSHNSYQIHHDWSHRTKPNLSATKHLPILPLQHIQHPWPSYCWYKNLRRRGLPSSRWPLTHVSTTTNSSTPIIFSRSAPRLVIQMLSIVCSRNIHQDEDHYLY